MTELCNQLIMKDVVSLEHLPKPIISNATNPQTNTEKVLCSKIYLNELENQAMEAKMTELGNWKRQEVYREEEDMGQSYISVRWVLSQKVKNGENITKARLCARDFGEVKDFPTDSPCCSRIGIRTIFILITSNQWEIKSVDVKTAFLQGKLIKRTAY